MTPKTDTPISDVVNRTRTKGTKYAYQAAIIDFFSFLSGVKREGRKITDKEFSRFEIYAAKYLQSIRSEERDVIQDLEDYALHLTREEIPPKTTNLRIAGCYKFFRYHRITISRNDKDAIRGNLPRYIHEITEEIDLDKVKIARILEFMDVRGRAIVLTLASSGMRIGEALKLTWKDIDLTVTPAKITIPDKITKTGRGRITFISAEAAEALELWKTNRDQYLREQKDRAKNLHNTTPTDNKTIFGTLPQVVYRMWDHAVKQSGFYQRDEKTGYSVVKVHALRKFFRTQAGKVLVPDMCEALIGHTSGLNAAYIRHGSTISEAYLKAMPQFTIREADFETKSALEQMKGENTELRAQIAYLTRQMEHITRAMNAGFTDGGLPPLPESPNPGNPARPDPLAEDYP